MEKFTASEWRDLAGACRAQAYIAERDGAKNDNPAVKEMFAKSKAKWDRLMQMCEYWVEQVE